MGIAICKANHKLDQELSVLRSPFISYVIDALYAIAYALEFFFLIYRCTDEQGFRIGDSCPSVHPTIKGRDLQKYLSNDSFDGLTGKVRFHRF